MASTLGGASQAAALEAPNLKDFLFGRHPEQSLPPGRYLPAEGEPFLLDRQPPGNILMRFDDNPEVLVLRPTAGPRGDVIYKNDNGQPILRATRLGGLTLFTVDHPDGAPAAFVSEGPAIRMAPIPSPSALFQTMVQASLRASRAAQHLVAFEAQDLTPKDLTPSASAVLADAAWTTAEAISRVAGRGPSGRSLAARFVKVQFITGREASARVSGQVVQITVSLDKGYNGRPSSARIITVMTQK